MTYNVFIGTLNPTQSKLLLDHGHLQAATDRLIVSSCVVNVDVCGRQAVGTGTAEWAACRCSASVGRHTAGNCHYTSPFPPVDSVWAMIDYLEDEREGKIIKTVLCCIVCDSYAQ